MFSILRKILIIFVLLLCLGAGCLYFILNSELVFEKVIPRIVNPHLDGIQVSELKIGQQRLWFPGGNYFEEVRLQVKQDEDVYLIYLKRISLDSILDFFAPAKKVFIDVTGLNVESSLIEVDQLDLSFIIDVTDSDQISIMGNLAIASVNFSEYQANGIIGSVSGDHSSMSVDDLTGTFYDGEIKGRIVVEYNEDISYLIHLGLTEVDLALMESVNPDLFSNVQGRMDGIVDVGGTSAGIKSVNASFSAPQGGKVKAVLLRTLIEQIPPNTQQRKELDILIKRGGYLPVNKAVINLENLDEERISVTIDLESKKFNLDPNLTIDVNVDGGLINLFSWLDKFSQ